MDKSSYGSIHVHGGLVNEAVVYEVSHHGDHPHTLMVDGLFLFIICIMQFHIYSELMHSVYMIYCH